MFKTLTRLFAAVVLLALVSCAPKTDGETVIVASIEPQRALLEQLVAPGTEIVTIMGRGANPETFEPTLAQRASVDNASVFFATGALPFEKALEESARATKFVDTSAGIEPIYGTHGHSHAHHDDGDSHGAPDPHVWSSVKSAKIMAANMARALIEADPDNTEMYSENLRKLDAHLDSLDAVLAERLQGAPTRAFAIWHPSLSYFARDYGLEQIIVGQEGKEMSARQLRDVIDTASGHNVKVFFFQREYDTRQAESINSALGARLVTIDPMAYDWEQQLIMISDELSRP